VDGSCTGASRGEADLDQILVGQLDPTSVDPAIDLLGRSGADDADERERLAGLLRKAAAVAAIPGARPGRRSGEASTHPGAA
jgi:hypothetical protein